MPELKINNSMNLASDRQMPRRVTTSHTCHDHNNGQRNCSRMAMKTCKALICWVGSSKGFHSCRLDQCLTAGLEFCQFCLLCTSLSSFRQRGWQWIWLCRAVTSPKPCFYFFGIDSSCRKSWYHDMALEQRPDVAMRYAGLVACSSVNVGGVASLMSAWLKSSSFFSLEASTWKVGSKMVKSNSSSLKHSSQHPQSSIHQDRPRKPANTSTGATPAK